MKVKIFGLAVILIVLIAISSFGFAHMTTNGITLNGLRWNGITLNGLRWNGITLNDSDSQSQGLDFSTIGKQALKK